MLKKIYFRPKKRQKKMHSFFFCEPQLSTVLILIRDFQPSSSTRFVYLKVCVGFSTLDSVSCHQSLYFCLTKSIDPLAFTPRLVIFKLQQQCCKFNDICVSRSFPKTDLETNFLNFRKLNFNNLLISLIELKNIGVNLKQIK